MNAESATNILDRLVQQKRGKPLNGLQRAIIQGVLDGLTYQEIKHNYAIAQNYEICYLARYVAYHLWKLLTEVLKDAGIIDPDERVRNKNLWESAMRVAQQSVQSESVPKSQLPVPPNPMLDRKLRMRYRITEDLVSTELSDTYLAEDEHLPDRPLPAVKRLKSQSIDETTKLCEPEARVLRKFGKRDRIPELLARFQEDRSFYLIVEFT